MLFVSAPQIFGQTPTVVVTWKLLTSVNLAVPIASFKQAAGQVPVFVSDKLWQWNYDFTLPLTCEVSFGPNKKDQETIVFS